MNLEKAVEKTLKNNKALFEDYRRECFKYSPNELVEMLMICSIKVDLLQVKLKKHEQESTENHQPAQATELTRISDLTLHETPRDTEERFNAQKGILPF